MTRPDAALPTGVVTFLLTDIEGSTQAWQNAPDSMTALVSRHYEILHRGVAMRHGQLPQEQGEGDSIVGVFVDPIDAVATALEMQRELLREIPDLPVRMALHTGEGILRNENNYVGLTIIRCARIRSCGHGGQILLSDATADAVRDNMPPHAAAVDLGLYGLRGLDGRQRIWQLTHPDIRADFAPLKAGASAAGNLPTPITSFVGRRGAIVAVGESLHSNRIVMLTGEPGVGKSRLALAAADAMANAMAGGVWWVSLGEMRTDDVDVVSLAIIRACAMEPPSEDPLDGIVDFFRSIADSLVVLDGIDSAPDAADAITNRILAACPDTRFLWTRREPLPAPGHIVHQVQPMEFPPDDFSGSLADIEPYDAARLFIERGVTARAGSAFLDGDAADIARICRALGGIPFGIELAAARTASTSTAAVASSLEALARAGGPSTDRAGTLTTLTSSIAWTYQFLSAEAQTALRRLCIFEGAFDIDAATAMATASPLDAGAATRAIRQLLDQHLITLDDQWGRLEISASTLAFGRDLVIERDEMPMLAARHGTWFAAVAEHFGEGGDDMPDSMLAPDLADLIAAIHASMGSSEPAVALRIIGGIGSRLPSLGRTDVARIASAWIQQRSPSDGEDRWAAAVAQLAVALTGEPDDTVHTLVAEARAIAEFNDDQRSLALLAGAGV